MISGQFVARKSSKLTEFSDLPVVPGKGKRKEKKKKIGRAGVAVTRYIRSGEVPRYNVSYLRLFAFFSSVDAREW